MFITATLFGIKCSFWNEGEVTFSELRADPGNTVNLLRVENHTGE
jgi:hypothetical protein